MSNFFRAPSAPSAVPAALVSQALPCPFCGSCALNIVKDGFHISVDCTSCLATGPACRSSDGRATPASVQADAVRSWNRATRPPAADLFAGREVAHV